MLVFLGVQRHVFQQPADCCVFTLDSDPLAIMLVPVLEVKYPQIQCRRAICSMYQMKDVNRHDKNVFPVTKLMLASSPTVHGNVRQQPVDCRGFPLGAVQFPPTIVSVFLKGNILEHGVKRQSKK